MTRIAIALLSALLVLVAPTAQADANKQKNSNSQGKSNSAQQDSGSYNNNKKNNDEGKNKDVSGKKNKSYQQDYEHDYSDIHRIFEQHKGQHPAYQDLPPGIRKNLQRGKPLPPGIAKKFDADMSRQLPHYPGYEWQRAGTDAVLINTTNLLVQEVMKGVLE